jgi:hypothetical protein
MKKSLYRNQELLFEMKVDNTLGMNKSSIDNYNYLKNVFSNCV